MLGLLVLTHNDIKHATHGSLLESSLAVTMWSCGFKISHKTSDKRKWLDVGAPGTYFTLERWSNEVMKEMAWDVSHVSCNPQRKYPRSHAGNGIRYPRTILTGWRLGRMAFSHFVIGVRNLDLGMSGLNWYSLSSYKIGATENSYLERLGKRSIQSFGLPESILWVQNHQDQ